MSAPDAGQARTFIGSGWADHDGSHRHKQLSTGRARKPPQCRAMSVPTDAECEVVAPPHAFAGGLPGDSRRPARPPPKHPPSAASMSEEYPQNPPAPRLCPSTPATDTRPHLGEGSPRRHGSMSLLESGGLAWLPGRWPRRLPSPDAVGHTYPTSRHRGINGCLCVLRGLREGPLGPCLAAPVPAPPVGPSTYRPMRRVLSELSWGLRLPRTSVASRSIDCGVGEGPRVQPAVPRCRPAAPGV